METILIELRRWAPTATILCLGIPKQSNQTHQVYGAATAQEAPTASRGDELRHLDEVFVRLKTGLHASFQPTVVDVYCFL